MSEQKQPWHWWHWPPARPKAYIALLMICGPLGLYPAWQAVSALVIGEIRWRSPSAIALAEDPLAFWVVFLVHFLCAALCCYLALMAAKTLLVIAARSSRRS